MLAVDRADFREMRLQKAACEHSGSDELIDAGSGEDSVALDLREHLNHVTRRDDVAKAKTRGEDLREGAEADRAVRRQIPDGDRRLLFVPEFAIRIVFNDPEIVLLGFFNQFQIVAVNITVLFRHSDLIPVTLNTLCKYIIQPQFIIIFKYCKAAISGLTFFLSNPRYFAATVTTVFFFFDISQ